MQADADAAAPPPGGPGAWNITRLVRNAGKAPRQSNVAGEQDLQAVERAIADATVAQIPEGGVETLADRRRVGSAGRSPVFGNASSAP